MPWRASSVMEERARFVLERERGEYSMSELCAIYGVSRDTGYTWWRRYQQAGLRELCERSRAPRWHPKQTAAEIEAAVLELRRAHMRWGARKLKRVLERERPETNWPAASTMGTMLAREGLVIARRKRRKTEPYSRPFAAATEPNRVWCVDFKGWFRTQDGERMDPLTVSDAHSRYLLRCQAVEKTDTARVQAIFEAAFREYGMPQAIRSDNGAPFASRAIAGLSRLAVWWMKLGIVPERIEAGHPEQNGRHERMHRTMKQEVAQPPAANRRKQQYALDRFRQEYNEVRPHEALGMRTPAEVYEPSARKFPEQLPEPEYPGYMLVRSVRRKGHFRWKQDDVFLSEVLWGERVGLLQEDDRWFTVYFAQHPIALFDSQQLRIAPLLTNSKLEEGEEDASPSPSLGPLVEPNQKVSDMRPV